MANANNQFKVLIERGEDGYFVARVPALPGCMTQAKTYEQLLRRVQEAIRLCLDVSGRDRQYRRSRRMRGHEPRFIGIEDVTVRT